jgi:DNA-binding transcriptional LysR family regulator
MTAFIEETVIISAAGKEIGELSPSCVLVFEHGCPYRKRLEQWCARRGFMPERVIELGSYHAMLGCVLAGMGIALLPECVLPTVYERKRLKVHRLPRGENRSTTLLIWRKGAGSPNVAALRDIIGKRRAKANS